MIPYDVAAQHPNLWVALATFVTLALIAFWTLRVNHTKVDAGLDKAEVWVSKYVFFEGTKWEW